MDIFKTYIRDYIRKFAKRKRKSLKLSQEELAELLNIATRSYSDLETGKFCFSSSTLLSFMLLLRDEELLGFVHGIREIIQHGSDNFLPDKQIKLK